MTPTREEVIRVARGISNTPLDAWSTPDLYGESQILKFAKHFYEAGLREKNARKDMPAAKDTRKQDRWDDVPDDFRDWWNGDYDDSNNPFRLNSSAYWAWAGWKAAEDKAGGESFLHDALYETIIQWDEAGGKRSRRELARRIASLYTHPQPKEKK